MGTIIVDPEDQSPNTIAPASWADAVNAALTALDGALDMSLITSTVLTGNAASVTFAAIPATYKHLLLILQARTDSTANIDAAEINFNNDTGNNYNIATVRGNSVGAAGASAENDSEFKPFINATASPANQFGSVKMLIYNYAVPDIFRNVTWEGGLTYVDGDASTILVENAHGVWKNAAAAISEIDLVPSAGANFVEFSSFQLYGMRV